MIPRYNQIDTYIPKDTQNDNYTVTMKQSLSSLRPSSRSTIQTRTQTQTQTQIAMIRTCTYTCLWCVILAMFQSMTIINAYPMMIEVKENDRKVS